MKLKKVGKVIAYYSIFNTIQDKINTVHSYVHDKAFIIQFTEAYPHIIFFILINIY